MPMIDSVINWTKDLGDRWAKASIAASAVLYLLGYLVIRFHLTAIGIGTDLSVLDERYFFAGARFVVYLVASIPSLVLLVVPLLLLAWGMWRLCPRTFRSSIRTFSSRPSILLVFGIIFAVGMIQFVMRQCFLLVNLLLSDSLPADPAWLVFLLNHDQWMPLYFSLLVAASVLSLAIASSLGKVSLSSGVWHAAKGLFVVLVVVQMLLLPVNYGVLIVDKVLPRVTALGSTPLAQGDRAWLVWEGRDGITFLLQTASHGRRSLLTLPRNDVKRIEIVGFDHIVPTLFAHAKIGAQSKLVLKP